MIWDPCIHGFLGVSLLRYRCFNSVRRHHRGTAALSIAIWWDLLATASLFHSRGLPMGQLVAAERACEEYKFASVRESCMQQWVAEWQTVTAEAVLAHGSTAM